MPRFTVKSLLLLTACVAVFIGFLWLWMGLFLLAAIVAVPIGVVAIISMFILAFSTARFRLSPPETSTAVTNAADSD